MSDPKPTRGPWVVNRGEHAYITNHLYKGIIAELCYRSEDDAPLFVCNPDDVMVREDQYEPNAYLLAAAPDLRDALRDLRDWIDAQGPENRDSPEDRARMEKADTALAKAEGRTA